MNPKHPNNSDIFPGYANNKEELRHPPWKTACYPTQGLVFFGARFSGFRFLGRSFGHFGWSILKNCCCRKNPFGYCLSYFGRPPLPLPLPFLFLFLFFRFSSCFLHAARCLLLVLQWIFNKWLMCIHRGTNCFPCPYICGVIPPTPKPRPSPSLFPQIFPGFPCPWLLFVLLTSPAACRLRKSLLKIITMWVRRTRLPYAVLEQRVG